MELVRSGKLAESTLSGGYDNQFRWEFHITFAVIVGDMQLFYIVHQKYNINNSTIDHANFYIMPYKQHECFAHSITLL